MNLSRIVLGLALIVGATGAVVSVTGAFFSDTETSIGNVFTAGAIDLLVDNESYATNATGTLVFSPSTSWPEGNLNDGVTTLHKFFDFGDLKPDDEGEDTISLHVQNDAYACMDVTLTSNDDNDTNEPEGLVDPAAVDALTNEWDGELAQAIEMFWWADDGDNVYEIGEETISDGVQTLYNLATTTPFSVALADSLGSIWPDNGPIPADEARFIGKMWCFGDLAETPVIQDAIGDTGTPGLGDSTNGPLTRGTGFTCDGIGFGNETQTDEATLDVEFTAVQARNNDDFRCEPPETFDQCETPSLAYADNVVSSDQGRRKNGTAVLANRSATSSVLGAPQSSGLPSDPAVPAGSFFSLGFKALPANATATTTPGGSIVVEFTNNVIVDGPGNDLQVWEVTGGVYPDEHIKIEVSQDGVTWFTAAADLTRDAQADLATSGLAWAKFVRLTDITPPGPFEPEADAYDLDAFSALNCGVPQNGGPVLIDVQ